LGLDALVGIKSASSFGNCPERSISSRNSPRRSAAAALPTIAPAEGPYNEIGRIVGYARTAEPVSEPEQPGNEIFAASAQHAGAVLAYPEGGRSGNWYGWISIDADVRLRVA